MIDNMFNNILDEVSAFVQPIINIKSGMPIGLEILLRRKAKNGEGYTSPETILEKTTSLEDHNAITLRLLEIVSGYRRYVHDQNVHQEPSFISLNIIAEQLACPTLVEKLIQFQQALPEGTDLLIELLEGHGKDLNDGIKSTIVSLSNYGIKFGIDDFGNNSICLKYLEALHLNVLKMDISMACIKGGKLLFEKTIQSLVYLAKRMNVLLIAEGVETKEQLILLQACGVQNVQGFYFKKPYPLDVLLT